MGKPIKSVALSEAASGRDPRERFVALANSRVNAAIHQLRLVGNLSNRRNYRYESEEAAKIIRVLQRELEDLKVRFRGESSREDEPFSL